MAVHVATVDSFAFLFIGIASSIRAEVILHVCISADQLESCKSLSANSGTRKRLNPSF